jgi:nucleoid-associated protein YgaU
MLKLIVSLLAVLFLGACTQYAGRTDKAMGVMMDADGTMRSTTDRNVQDIHCNLLKQRLVESLALEQVDQIEQAEATIHITNAVLPKHLLDSRDMGTWQYEQVDLTVTVPSDFALSDSEIYDLALAYYAKKFTKPRSTGPERFAATVTRADAAPATPVASAGPAAAPKTAPAPKPPVAVAANSGQATSYTIQDGDTLGAIAAVFYGSAQHWRRIVDANPGLDPGALSTGQVIAIPPAE